MPRSVTYVGVDPGRFGGLVAIYRNRVLAVPMPSTEYDVWKWFYDLCLHGGNVVAVIERVHSMPKQGVASMFKFGMGYGGLRMALIAASIAFEDATPQKWQKALDISPRKKAESKSQWKNRLRGIAQQLYPTLPVWKEGKGAQLAVADAILIATYCRSRRHYLPSGSRSPGILAAKPNKNLYGMRGVDFKYSSEERGRA